MGFFQWLSDFGNRYIVEMGGEGGNDLDIPRQALVRLRRLGK